jgi:hypothetical protein
MVPKVAAPAEADEEGVVWANETLPADSASSSPRALLFFSLFYFLVHKVVMPPFTPLARKWFCLLLKPAGRAYGQPCILV